MIPGNRQTLIQGANGAKSCGSESFWEMREACFNLLRTFLMEQGFFLFVFRTYVKAKNYCKKE